jgi:NADH:ubiquinone oxidoreductase subunit
MRIRLEKERFCSFARANPLHWTEPWGVGISPIKACGASPSAPGKAMGVKTFFLKCFTWWNGSTFGMDLFTRRKGEKVGSDDYGNVYYRSRNGEKDKALGHERRWVIYKGEAEASRVPPGWAGWLAFTYDKAPSQEDYKPREWQMPHEPNMTGTALAYRPKGSTLGQGERQPTGGDYKPWTPAG